MPSISKLAIAAGALLALGACGPRSNQNDAANQAANKSVDAGAGAPEATAPSANVAEPEPNSVSSGMPVPGTNTPEHIVVNEDANAS